MVTTQGALRRVGENLALPGGRKKLFDKNPVRALNVERGSGLRLNRDARFSPPHFQAMKALVDFKLIARSKLRFAHEALFGVGAGCFEEMLHGTTCRVTTFNGKHDPNFGGINPEPIRAQLEPVECLKKHLHDICLVTDGDADRVGGMDGRGRCRSTTHQIICLLLHHFIVNRKATDA